MADAVHETTTIDVGRERVWEILMDPTRLGEWVSAHRELDELPELPLSEGDRFRQRLGIGPVSFWVEWEIVELERPARTRWRGSGPGGSQAAVTYELEADGESTSFRYENDFDPPGGAMGKAAKRVVNAAAGRREARKSLRRLRELLEADDA